MVEPSGLSDLRPLPRSLDPLEDESLPGYLLRLSYRLSIGPGPLVLRAGLPNSRRDRTTLIRIPVSFAVSLDEPDSIALCYSTRLSRREADGLLLASLGSRYGALNPVYRGRRPHRGRDSFSTRRLQYNNPWVLTTRTQYCPDCLAGDGSEIQQSLGGAWRRLWRLPPVFCCPRHERFLRRYCHHCGELVQNRHSNDLSARPRDSELHPLQCRATPRQGELRAASPACGADLTQAPKDTEPMLKDPRSRNALFALQRKFLSFLSPDGPKQVSSVGWIIPTAQYFQDLRGVVALIFMTWPQARPHAATSELARVIDAEAARRHGLFHRLGEEPRKNLRSTAYTDPPDGPVVTGAVLEIAHRLLRSPDEIAAAELLVPLVDEAKRIHQPISYPLRSPCGASIPLLVVLAYRPRGSRSRRDHIERIAEGRSIRAMSSCD
ncbi:TniQ family protein [Streptomyces olivaceus]|nr:TniQ family protein [Streptomyces olivaceus]